MHIDSEVSKPSTRLAWKNTKYQLSKVLDSLTISLFLYGLEVWGSEYQGKYPDRTPFLISASLSFWLYK